MSDLGENLRTTIIASTAIAAVFPGLADPGAVQQGVEMENPPLPRIWYQRTNEEDDRDLEGGPGLVTSEWTIEVISDDLDEAQEIALAARRYLDCYRGALGTQTVEGIFAGSQTDDYVPGGVAAESGLCVSALALQIFLNST